MDVGEARGQYVRWLLVTRDLSPHTIRAYDGDLAAFERHVGAGASARTIDRDRLLAFIEAQRAAGLCSTSIRRRASALRGFCTWLRSRDVIDADPWLGTSVGGGRSRRLPRLLTSHELDRLLAFLRVTAGVGHGSAADAPRDRPEEFTTLLAVALMVATGVRVNELAGIRCPDIDLAGRSVRILGKGRRERHVFLTNDWIRDLTAAYLGLRGDLGIQHPYLLFNANHDPLSPAAVRTRLTKAARDAGIAAHVTPHMLRHTAATQLIEAGVDIRYIQRLLGHASLMTTQIYTHVSDRALRQVVSEADVLGRRLQPG
jgi:integrase/recombinase XerD